jgi:glycerate kinase
MGARGSVGARIVVAPDSFKGSITAARAAEALREGILDAAPDAGVVLRPMADGGEGTLDAFATAVPGARRMPVTVRGPHGRDVSASWLLLPPGGKEGTGGTGVVELASTSGIELMGDARAPWDAGTDGFGQAIAAALDHGVSRLVLGIGSSASTDGGWGLLRALGARGAPGRHATGEQAMGEPTTGLCALADLAGIDLTGLRALPPDGVVVLTDVTNPLLGERGAAAVFGPQKGLSGADIALADAALARWARLLPADPDAAGAGAAGGTGFALAAWGAELRRGADDVARLIGLDAALASATLVVTGEGSFDGQSASGKVPSLVAARAAAARVPVALVAGTIAADADTSAFVRTVSLATLAGGDPAASMADPSRWLRAAGAALAHP